jgi:hypothetical protein
VVIVEGMEGPGLRQALLEASEHSLHDLPQAYTVVGHSSARTSIGFRY